MPYDEPEEHRPDPPLRTQITGPLAWEDDALPWPQRLSRTFGATFAPLATLHAVVHGEIAPAVRFMLVSALPFMALWAIIPFTHTLLFKPEFALEVVHAPGGPPVALDVARAVAIGVGLSVISLLSWGVPFVSLLRGFADGPRPEDPSRAAWRTVLYRAWVIPCGMAFFSFMLWALPKQPNPFLIELIVIGFRMLPRVLILIHCHAVARYFGLSGFGALAVSVLPLVVEWAVDLTVQRGAEQLLPATATDADTA